MIGALTLQRSPLPRWRWSPSGPVDTGAPVSTSAGNPRPLSPVEVFY